MVRDLVRYPDKTINIISPDQRSFDETLFSLLDDLKDTLEAHHVQALAAIQIGVPVSAIIVKQKDGEYLEIINPRIIGKKGQIQSTESTLYFPDTTHTVTRFEQIRLIYQDRHGEQKSMKAEGELAILLQRKIDYVYGGTLANRLTEKERENMGKDLAKAGLQGSFENCPTVFKRDYFISMIQKVLFFMSLTLLAPLFSLSDATVSKIITFDQYASGVLVLLLAGYFYVAMGESKKYGACSGCQTGNIVATTIQYALISILLSAATYFVLR